MKYLLDTNVISEVFKPRPEESVVRFIETVERGSTAISAMTLGELRAGAARHRDPLQRTKFLAWTAAAMEEYSSRILPFDRDAALVYADVGTSLLRQGRSSGFTDLIILATAMTNNLILVTRNHRHFDVPGLDVFNPWDQTAT